MRSPVMNSSTMNGVSCGGHVRPQTAQITTRSRSGATNEASTKKRKRKHNATSRDSGDTLTIARPVTTTRTGTLETHVRTAANTTKHEFGCRVLEMSNEDIR